MTYIGSVRDTHMMQDRMPRLCPEGVEDFGCTLLSGMPVPTIPQHAAKAAAARIAALEAELAAARAALAATADQARELTGQTTKGAQHPLERALATWPGSGHTNQLTGKAAWW